MGKSSLGKRKTSLVPLRMSSLGDIGERPDQINSQRGRSSVKKSQIPRFSRNRTRSSSSDHAATKQLSSVMSLPRSRSNSNLQMLGLATPMTPMYMMMGIPGTTQSSKKCMSESKLRGRAIKSTMKDPRPLTEKQYQSVAVKKIQEYFMNIDDRDLVVEASKAMSTRSLTLKLFVSMVSHLLSHFFKKHIINMSNYEDEVPHLCRTIGYPGSVKKSWLKIANSTHSWPNVVGLLSWLVSIIETYIPEHHMQIMFPPDEDVEDLGNHILDRKKMFFYYLKCHYLFNKEASKEEMAEVDEQLHQEMVQKLNIDDSEFEALTQKIRKLQVQLEDPYDLEAQRETHEQEQANASIENDCKKLQSCLEKRVTFSNMLQNEKLELTTSQDKLKTHREKKRVDIARMLQILESQSITLEDKKRIERECRDLEEAITVHNTGIDKWSKTVFADDLKIAKLKSELNNICIGYRTSIMENSNSMPELNNFLVKINYLHKGADVVFQEMDEQMENLRMQIKVKVSEVKQQVEEREESVADLEEKKFVTSEENHKCMSQVDKLKAEVADFKEKIKQEEVQLTYDMEQMKEGNIYIASNIPSLEEAENGLKDVKKRIGSIETHIAITKEEGKTFFAEYDAIYNKTVQKMKDQIGCLLNVKRQDQKHREK